MKDRTDAKPAITGEGLKNRESRAQRKRSTSHNENASSDDRFYGLKPSRSRPWKKSLIEWFWFLFILLGLWSITALVMDNALVCPTPWACLEQMVLQVQNPTFLLSAFSTIGRAMESLVLSFVLGLAASFLGAFWKPAGSFLGKLVSLFQTVPNVCYIILLLFWTSREQTVILTGFFLLFPLVYREFYEQLESLKKRYAEVWKIYPQPAWVRMFVICLPMMKPAFLSALKSASSLAFKVCVTSEILTGLQPGIGKSLQMARLDLNPAGVVGWSIWLILIVFCFEKLWNWIADRLFGDGSVR